MKNMNQARLDYRLSHDANEEGRSPNIRSIISSADDVINILLRPIRKKKIVSFDFDMLERAKQINDIRSIRSDYELDIE
jgi:hypothetical protein